MMAVLFPNEPKPRIITYQQLVIRILSRGVSLCWSDGFFVHVYWKKIDREASQFVAGKFNLNALNFQCSGK